MGMLVSPDVETVLVDTVARLRWDELGPSTRHEAVRAVLDYLAAALGGYRYGDVRPALERIVSPSPDGECALVGSSGRACLSNAVLFNSAMGNGVELDDGQREGSVHAGSVAVPVALIVGHLLGRSGPEVLEAIVAGYEVMARIAAAINPGALRRSFHTSGYTGPIGAAMVAGKLLRLSEGSLRGAFGTAGLLGAGFMESTRTGQVVKPIHVGRAAQGGILAARLAAEGIYGPLQVLSGPKGMVQAVTQKVDWERMARGNPSGHPEIESRYVKTYPTVGHIHTAIDLALDMHRNYKPRLEDVSAVCITTYSIAAREGGEIVAPTSTAEARFSMRYCVARAMLEGHLTNDDMQPEALWDPEVLALARRIDVVVGPAEDALYPKERATIMRVDLGGGPVTLRTSFSRGEPENPLSDLELEGKFLTYAGDTVGTDRVAEIIHSVRALPDALTCPDLIAACRVNE